MSVHHHQKLVNTAIVAGTLAAVLAGGAWLSQALQWRGAMTISTSEPSTAAQARLEHGWGALRRGSTREASRAFRDALRATPGWPEALRGLAWAQARLGRYHVAALAMSRAMAAAGEVRRGDRAALLAWQQALLRSAGTRYGNADDTAQAGGW